MLLLVTDTSGRNGTVALAHAAESGVVDVLEVVPLAGGMFSAQLVPQIAALLQNHGFTKNDIGAFIVVSGPGSFTGLRVGLAAIKALAEILHKPIVPVSLLEVIALAANPEGRILAALDAGRGDVYAGEYEVFGGKIRTLRERLLPRDEFIANANGFIVATPDHSTIEAARAAGVKTSALENVTAAMILRLGWQRMQAGESVAPEQLEANYMRRSDAEIFAKPAS